MTQDNMNAILICPAERPVTRFLAQTAPFAALHAFAKPLVVYWLENLAALGARCVLILAADRPEQIRALVGDGSRWGLNVEVLDESRELSADEARAKYCPNPSRCLPQPLDVSVMDHFPGLPEHPLFKSYANWFDGLRALLPCVTASKRNDACEVKPGVWVSPRARVSSGAELRAPCWIGPHTVIAADTVIGPMAVIEDRVMVEPGVEIANSSIAPETFVGRLTELKNSVADGSILINWRSASCTRVPDTFLLCSLAKRRHTIKSSNLFARLLALFVMILTLPVALLPILWAAIRKQPAFRPHIAVRPFHSTEPGTMATLVFHELFCGGRFLRVWPQLWNIFKGDFAWVGNRPLSPGQVADLSNDFERLWLAAPIGLFSLAQAEGAIDSLETRACASLYALQANWRLDLSIIARAFVSATKRPSTVLS
ncbi:MAG TPA: sugar transferase [Verrucomicrobiae bacterium]|nr:sugar transferase [Verrucomicrobiae bacterium]